MLDVLHALPESELWIPAFGQEEGHKEGCHLATIHVIMKTGVPIVIATDSNEVNLCEGQCWQFSF